ncbi:MAG: hypothetical protein L3J36_08320 [Rhodobacteraceae bacterium]|nr:hypothetical protein [Paracoccaceae bacterium]
MDLDVVMSDYAGRWKAAKLKFEAATGGKKPKVTKKGLFTKARGKTSGVQSLLKVVDKLIPDSMLDPVSDKKIVKINKAVSAVKTSGVSYMADILAAVKREKDEFGKEESVIYRDLKILRSELDAIVAAIVSDQAKMYACREATIKEVSGGVKVTYMTLKTVAEGIDKTCKEGIAWAQTVLKDPTPENYNDTIFKKARNITQNFSQIVKYTVPEEASLAAQRSRLQTLEDPKIAQLVVDLDKRVTVAKEGAVPITKETGHDPFDSSLGKMGNNPVRLHDDADPDEVKAAIKHFLMQVKEAMEVRKRIW